MAEASLVPDGRFIKLDLECRQAVDVFAKSKSLTEKDEAFINCYKIHTELIDAVIELVKSAKLNHITSSIILRSVLENLAALNHILESQDSVAKSYNKHTKVFIGKSPQRIRELIHKVQFKHLVRYDGSTTEERVNKLADSSKRAYDLMSVYAHASPSTTAQMSTNSEKVTNTKRMNLNMVYVTYLAALSYAFIARVKFDGQNEAIQELMALCKEHA